MRNKEKLIDAGKLKDIFIYKDGTLLWKKREEKGDKYIKAFNTRHANKRAGTLIKKGSYIVNLNGVLIPAHHIVWAMHYGEWADNDIIHIDGDSGNNQLSNLKGVARVNTINRCDGRGHPNTSGCVGVSWDSKAKRWGAEFQKNKIKRKLGKFTNKNDAIKARLLAEYEHGYSDKSK